MDTSKLRELDAAVAHVVGLEWFGETVAGLEVQGDAEVAGVRMPMVPFDAVADVSDRWLVIEQGTAHEFFPQGEDMTVVSFHTCPPQELEEVECDSGGLRHYEGPDV